jgi:hypothetical protein
MADKKAVEIRKASSKNIHGMSFIRAQVGNLASTIQN